MARAWAPRAGIGIAWVALCEALASGRLLVNTSLGRVRGVERGGFRVFRGIPYAAPPVGDLRWRPPRAHPGWEGTLDAADFGPTCVRPKCWRSDNVVRVSEDCLTINVLSPQRPGRYPVMVVLHAGEFHCGSSNDGEFNWPRFADDLVYVSMNSRLGVFGYLASDDLRGRDPRNGTGSYGLLDQRLALEWVQANIGAFEGDASRVTIWGESSGATSVAYHLTAHGAAPTSLFRRAILQSPGLTQVKPWADAAQNFEYILAALTAAASPNCSRSPGYATFRQDRLFTKSPLRVGLKESVGDAEAWCDRRAACAGFWSDQANRTFYVSNSSFSILDVSVFGAETLLFIKRGPVSSDARLRCLLSADAERLNAVTLTGPRDDTFWTDLWAPVVDGVHLQEPILERVFKGAVAEGVDVLAGTNLDEGTQFMYETPPLSCTADAAGLQKWASSFFGPDVGPRVLPLYQNLTRPLPDCQDFRWPAVPGEEAVHRTAAMRAAGDAAIGCPTFLLAHSATGRTFVYDFRVTPTFSVNTPNTNTQGAFHGAEVPFVFGDVFELRTAEERNVSAAMGCFWRSFAWHGDPGVEACRGPRWPAFTSRGNPVMQFGPGADVEVHGEHAALDARCALFLRPPGLRVGGGGPAAAEETRDLVI